MTKELVVAYFKEDLNWLEEITDSKITIYNKSSMDLDNTISLPNFGREMHTYFHHIVENYDNLSDWVFFTQGNPFDHVKDYVEIVNQFPDSLHQSKLSIDDCHFFSYGYDYDIPLKSISNGLPHHDGSLNIDGLWGLLFSSPPPNEYDFVAGCTFCVTREQILMREKSFYEKCLDTSIHRIAAPWEFERLMYNVFNKNVQ
jgi:hypothetical protein